MIILIKALVGFYGCAAENWLRLMVNSLSQITSAFDLFLKKYGNVTFELVLFSWSKSLKNHQVTIHQFGLESFGAVTA